MAARSLAARSLAARAGGSVWRRRCGRVAARSVAARSVAARSRSAVPVCGPGGPAFGGPWGGSWLRDSGGGFRGWICGAREDGGALQLFLRRPGGCGRPGSSAPAPSSAPAGPLGGSAGGGLGHRVAARSPAARSPAARAGGGSVPVSGPGLRSWWSHLRRSLGRQRSAASGLRGGFRGGFAARARTAGHCSSFYEGPAVAAVPVALP